MFTKRMADENKKMRRMASAMLKTSGWSPDESSDGSGKITSRTQQICSQVLAHIQAEFPEVAKNRVLGQIFNVMSEARGYKRGEW